MGRTQRSSAVRKKKLTDFPQVFVDRESDFASIKLEAGVEVKSYEKDGFVFCEDKTGRIIEVQVLNLSEFGKRSAA